MNREILRLAIPNIISNISVPLLSTVDTALMGRLSELHIGAVGVGAMIFNFIYWNFGFLRMGTTGITAQAFGREDEPGMAQTLGRALFVVLVIALLVLLLQYPLGALSFYLMNVDGQQQALVAEYFYLRVWAAPATLGLYAFMGWFFGMQNAIYPLLLTVVINVVNIALSFLFVQVYGMDVDGVALGTVIAQYVGLALAVLLFFGRYGYLRGYFRRQAILLWQELYRFLRINADIFIRTFLLTFAFGFFYSRSSAGGEIVLAVNVILLQYLNWMSYGIDGFAFATEALVGKYAGAAHSRNANRAIRIAFTWGMGLALLFSLAYGFFGEELLRIYTNQEDVIRAALPYLFWMALFPLLSTPCYIWDGVFIGLTASRAMRNTMLLAFTVYLLAYWLLGARFGNHGLWASLLLFMVARGGMQHAFFAWKGVGLR
jgi:MATE family multidrug resistance protein